MKKNFLEALKTQKLFKLVLGLGNQSLINIEESVFVYAHTDCDMFDLNASEEAILTAFNAIEKAGKKPEDFYFAISVGISGDTHTQKAFINKEKCKNCSKCAKKCPQNAIEFKDSYYCVIKEKCIGCKKCSDCKAISFTDTEQNIEKTVNLVNKYNIDCIELHLSSKKIPNDEIKYILKNTKAMLSLCLDRKYYSNEKIKKLINKVIKWKKDSTDFIIQADGVPMSGGEDDYNSTLQAVAMAHIVRDFDTFIFMSGGTNSKTSELAKLCNIRYNGISVGSYARKIIKSQPFEQAVKNAQNLVESCKNDD